MMVDIADEIKKAIAENPNLGPYGFMPHHKRDFDIEVVSVCLEFLSLCGKTRNWQAKHEKSSYHIKHMIEKWMEISGRQMYIGSGDVILASIILGFSWHRCDPNAYIGVRSRADKLHLLPPYSKTWIET